MDVDQYLKTYLDEKGRIKVYPSKRKFKTLCLFYLATKFELGRTYCEAEINNIIKGNHLFDDHCLLRRELLTHRMLSRNSDGASYWLNENQPEYSDFKELVDLAN